MYKSYLVVGAGPCGLAMAKALKEASIKYEQVEADEELGGNWYHGVYDTVYTDACKEIMQYPDFAIPGTWPDFLSKDHMLKYLNDYADYFDLRGQIQFNKKVISIDALQDNLWQATFENETSDIYKGIIVCTGHHWDPDHPDLKGMFGGEYIHSKEYKNPDQLMGKKVLVIGSGNSAVDIACEAARVGRLSYLSMRDSPWIFPKTFMGMPLSRRRNRSFPGFIAKLLARLVIKISFGKHSDYGMPAPRHRLFEKHPTVSEELPAYIRHGRVIVKQEILRTEYNKVLFDDGSIQEFDMIIGATGYKLSFPFLPDKLVRKEGKHLKTIGHCTYPDYKGLYFLGWQQVRGGVGSLAGAFSKVIVDCITIEEKHNVAAGAVLAAMQNKITGRHLYGSGEILRWIKKHDLKKMEKYARKINNGKTYMNEPLFYTEKAELEMRVF